LIDRVASLGLTLPLLGLAIGLVKAVLPLGPTGVVIVRRALEARYGQGLAVAVGGICAELPYCYAAVLGIPLLVSTWPRLADVLSWISVAILFGVGGYMVFSPAAARPTSRAEPRRGHASGFVLGLTLSLFNPTLLATWTLTISLITEITGLTFRGWPALVFPLGVASGTFLWDATLMWIARRKQRMIGPRAVGVLIRVLGVVLWGIASWRLVERIEAAPSREIPNFQAPTSR
jgi:threonine/homoserine/homoserine lactone efflux protein